MKESAILGIVESLRATMMLVLLLIAIGCAVESGPVPRDRKPSEEVRKVEVEQLASGDRGLGQRRVITASSAADLSEATGLEIPDSGSGTYLAAFWGEKRTGGYSVTVESARPSGGRITVRLALREPPPDAFVTQALTYPYAVALLPGVSREGKDFVFAGEDGRELGWPVSDAGGD